jgi:hypothetical protein
VGAAGAACAFGTVGVTGAIAVFGATAASCASACRALPKVEAAMNATPAKKANERLTGKRMVAAIKHPHEQESRGYEHQHTAE